MCSRWDDEQQTHVNNLFLLLLWSTYDSNECYTVDRNPKDIKVEVNQIREVAAADLCGIFCVLLTDMTLQYDNKW